MQRHCLEIRSYELVGGMQAAFEDLFSGSVLPLLKTWKTDVVFAGPSPHQEDTFILMRRYGSLADREASQDAFYSSPEWREGPREAMLEMIAAYTSAALLLGEETIRALATDLHDQTEPASGAERPTLPLQTEEPDPT